MWKHIEWIWTLCSELAASSMFPLIGALTAWSNSTCDTTAMLLPSLSPSTAPPAATSPVYYHALTHPKAPINMLRNEFRLRNGATNPSATWIFRPPGLCMCCMIANVFVCTYYVFVNRCRCLQGWICTSMVQKRQRRTLYILLYVYTIHIHIHVSVCQSLFYMHAVCIA